MRSHVRYLSHIFAFVDWVRSRWFQVGHQDARRSASRFLYCPLGNSTAWYARLVLPPDSYVIFICRFISILGGILAQMFGTKLVFGWEILEHDFSNFIFIGLIFFRFANFFGCITCFLVPIAAYWNFYALFWLRLIQGFVAGAAWPAMSHMVGKCINQILFLEYIYINFLFRKMDSA